MIRCRAATPAAARHQFNTPCRSTTNALTTYALRRQRFVKRLSSFFPKEYCCCDARLRREHRLRLVHLPPFDQAADRRGEFLEAGIGYKVWRTRTGRAALFQTEVAAQCHRGFRLLRAFLATTGIYGVAGVRRGEWCWKLRGDARSAGTHSNALRQRHRSEA